MMNSIWSRAAFVLLGSLLLAHASMGEDRFIERKAEGYFWYDDPVDPPPPKKGKPVAKKEEPKKEEPKKEEQPKSVAVEVKGPPAFSVKWVQENIERLREVAIDNPTDANVAAYLYAQRVMMDKAEGFATAVQRVAKTDPVLDENNRFPVASAMRMAALTRVEKKKEEALKSLSALGGIFYFFDSKCHFCITQKPVVEHVAKNYGFTVKYVSVDGGQIEGITNALRDNGQARALELKVFPSLVYAIPSQNKWVVLSQGLLSGDAIDARLLLAGETQGLLSKDMLGEIDPLRKGLLTAEDLKAQKDLDEMAKDPEKWVKFLRKTIADKY